MSQQFSRLVGQRMSYSEIGDNPTMYSSPSQQPSRNIPRHYKILGLVLVSLMVGYYSGSSSATTQPTSTKTTKSKKKNQDCQFCHQKPPILHHDQSYKIQLPSLGSESGIKAKQQQEPVEVIPMTIAYDYELYDGQLFYTSVRNEFIPNLDKDYAILAVNGARNLNRHTGADVSLDEVYVHHFGISSLNMVGAEVLNRNATEDPYLKFPEGYAIHVIVDELPKIGTNAHLLSNKHLKPIDGSLERARKECNECYYSPSQTKGSDCTPEFSGTFLCCGDSPSCTEGGEDCSCPVTTRHPKKSITKYRFELDLLVSHQLDRFRRADQWTLAAPACSVNINGKGVFEDYPPDSFCARKNQTDHFTSPVQTLFFGGGSAFHHVNENNEHPYVRTSISVLAPTSGRILTAQSHLHTGGVNATLYQNGKVLCQTKALYGNDPDVRTNARNEQNHLVKIESCYDQIPSDGLLFQQGDVFRTESVYYAGTDDQRLIGKGAAGEHKNVMSMFAMTVAFDGDSGFLTRKRTSSLFWNNFEALAGVHRSSPHAKADFGKHRLRS